MKKVLSVIIALAFMLSVIPTFTASAASYSGDCGDNVYWSLDTDTGVLDITGTGDMYSFHLYLPSCSSDAPWNSYSGYITTVNIANGVTSIGHVAFSDCSNLTSITIPDSVTSIGWLAFPGCSSLTSITIPDGVTSIGNYMFSGCSSLTSITIPDGVTSIGEGAFSGCSSLTSITIPYSVTSIGDDAFYGCNNLKTVYYCGSEADRNSISIETNNDCLTSATWIYSYCVHNYTTIVTAPTCTEQGYTTHTCSNCGDSYVDSYVPALGHDLHIEWSTLGGEAAEPDCAYGDFPLFIYPNSGLTHECFHTLYEINRCFRCGYYEFLGDQKKDESLYTSTVTPPTCTEQGYTTHSHDCRCWYCGSIFDSDSYIDNYVPATGHSYTNTVTAPTCTEQGYTTHTCSNCGDSYVDSYVPALGHNFGEWILRSTLGCETDGVEYRICSTCGYEATKVTKATGHKYTSSVTAPTCTEQGYTTHTCSICGDSYVDSYVPATDHGFTDWSVTKAPTCTEMGSKIRECTVCHIAETAEIAAIGHNYTVTAVPATCTEDGYTTHICAICGDSFITDKTAAIGHSWYVYRTTLPTCVKQGNQILECEGCDEYQVIILPLAPHSYGKWTPTGDGVTQSRSCTVCGHTEVSEIANHIHSFGEWIFEKESTCCEEGLEYRECAECDAVEKRITSTKAHNYKSTVVIPTKEAAGERIMTCEDCGHVERVTLPYLNVGRKSMNVNNNLTMDFYVDLNNFSISGYDAVSAKFTVDNKWEITVTSFTYMGDYLIFNLAGLHKTDLGQKIKIEIFGTVEGVAYKCCEISYSALDVLDTKPDGKIDILDFIRARKILAETDEERENGPDVDGNGIYELVDLVIFKKLIMFAF